MNTHLFGFKPIPYSLHFWKHSLNLCRCVSISLYIIKVIQKHLHETIKIIFKCFNQNSFVCWRSILHSKWHHPPYERFPICDKCNLYTLGKECVWPLCLNVRIYCRSLHIYVLPSSLVYKIMNINLFFHEVTMLQSWKSYFEWWVIRIFEGRNCSFECQIKCVGVG